LEAHADSPSLTLQICPKTLAHFERYVSGIFDRNYNPSP
jgi:hypothetical protein